MGLLLMSLILATEASQFRMSSNSKDTFRRLLENQSARRRLWPRNPDAYTKDGLREMIKGFGAQIPSTGFPLYRETWGLPEESDQTNWHRSEDYRLMDRRNNSKRQTQYGSYVS